MSADLGSSESDASTIVLSSPAALSLKPSAVAIAFSYIQSEQSATGTGATKAHSQGAL